MAFSYSGNPMDSDLDMVRFLIQDTNASDPLLQDEEILAIIATEATVYFAAARAAEVIAYQFARLTDVRIGDYSESAGQLFDHYMRLSAKLKTSATLKSVVPYAGGISVSDKQTDETNADTVKPRFKRGLFDNPGGLNVND